VRQQQRDFSLLMEVMRDFNERQSQLFFLVMTFLARYDPPELQPLIDDDVGEAVAALAATFETASRGVIYEHRPASLPAERLMSALKPVFAEVGAGGGSAFERDAAVVLRRLEDAARDARAVEPENRRALLDVIGRVISRGARGGDAEAAPQAPESRLIVP
jgi:hypothetical protein